MRHRETYVKQIEGRWLAVYVDFEGDEGTVVDAEYLSDEEVERRVAEVRKAGRMIYERKDDGHAAGR